MSSAVSSGGKIPLVDLGQIGLAHEGEASREEWQRVARLLCDAFTDIGFVYLTNHGVPDDQLNRLFESGAAFFRLDQATKERYPRDPKEQHGYVAVDRETLDPKRNAHELRESYNVRSGDGIFPDVEVESFRPAAVGFLKTCLDLNTRILTALALGLGLEENFFVSTHQNICGYENKSCLRLLHYPPVPANVPENSTRCGIHTDYGTITLLFQDAMGGLQDTLMVSSKVCPVVGHIGDTFPFSRSTRASSKMLLTAAMGRIMTSTEKVIKHDLRPSDIHIRPVRDRQGLWVDADSIPGTILVNVGDLLQFWTANKFIATEHRVLIPGEELRLRSSRSSIAFFIHPDDPVLIKPLDGSSTYQPISAGEHVLKKFSATYNY